MRQLVNLTTAGESGFDELILGISATILKHEILDKFGTSQTSVGVASWKNSEIFFSTATLEKRMALDISSAFEFA